jgi:S1-C subfamily serine protease
MSQTYDYVGHNIVRIVDDISNFHGTGFFVEIKQGKYCITCHHCICRLNEIFVERSGIRSKAEWIKELSDMNKDIAILKVDGPNTTNALKYAQEAMEKLPVSVWGFSFKDLEVLPEGRKRHTFRFLYAF